MHRVACKLVRLAQTCALGAAGARSLPLLHNLMCAGTHDRPQPPVTDPQCATRTYKQLYRIYRKLHDALGTKEWNGNLYDVMKELIEIRDACGNRVIMAGKEPEFSEEKRCGHCGNVAPMRKVAQFDDTLTHRTIRVNFIGLKASVMN